MPIILVPLVQNTMMIRQTGWKAIFFICKANHQSWLWFPPGDLFVLVVVVSRTWKVFAILSFFLNFSSHLHALGLISNDLPGQGVDRQGLPAPLDQAGLVHLPHQPWWSRCWHLSRHRAGRRNFGRSGRTKEVVERVVGGLRQVGCRLQSWLLVSQLKCWGHPALSVKESKIG